MPPWIVRPGQVINIRGHNYRFCGRIGSPTEIFAASGSRGRVYKLEKVDGSTQYALKVFRKKYRTNAVLSAAEFTRNFARFPGMEVCDRVVLERETDGALVDSANELEYAVLMPWVSGVSWWDIVSQKTLVDSQSNLTLARSVVDILVALEQANAAHCDVGNTNIIFDQRQNKVHLIDVEEMYVAGRPRPGVAFGTPGYRHQLNPAELWGPYADRFSAAVLLCEILGWHDPRVQARSGPEHYFEQTELQDPGGQSYHLLLNVISSRSAKLAELFQAAWVSKRLSNCPTLAQWQEAIYNIGGTPQRRAGTGPSGQPISWQPVSRRQSRTTNSRKPVLRWLGVLLFGILALALLLNSDFRGSNSTMVGVASLATTQTPIVAVVGTVVTTSFTETIPTLVTPTVYILSTDDRSVAPENIAMGRLVTITTNNEDDNREEPPANASATVTDGSLRYIPGGRNALNAAQRGVIGFVNHDYNRLMEVGITISFGGNYRVSRVRYNPGNVMFAGYWNADVMESPFGTTRTRRGSDYHGVWTEQTGDYIGGDITIVFQKTRTSHYTDWLFIGEVEVYGVPVV